MQRLSLLGARSSQITHICNFKCLQKQCSVSLIRTFATRSPLAETDSGPKIRWYQQLYPGSADRRPADPDDLDDSENDPEVQWCKAEISRLDDELRELRGEGKDGKTLIEPLLARLSEEDQRTVRLEIKKHELIEAQKTKQLARILPELEIKWQLPAEQNAYLRILNVNIRKATVRLKEPKLRKALWHSYARCKAFLPPFLHQIPDPAWAILYRAQALAAMDEDQHWAKNTMTLLDDMVSVGKEVVPSQKLLYVEALRNLGRHDEAIVQWQQLRASIYGGQRHLAEYELLGVRLFTSPGNLEKAEQLASEYLGHDEQGDSRILIPILRSWIERGDEVGMKHAWALYLRLRVQLGLDITMDEYDNISLAFLNGRRTDLALAVFKDMMLTGQQDGQESVSLYTKTLGILEKVQSSSISADELNKIPLAALTVLPKHFQNRFFFGKWLKKLLGMGHTDAAASVVELMHERGVKRDAKHLNGVIGAWLRSGDDADKGKAEKMAWTMVQERIQFVKRRKVPLEPLRPETTTDFHPPVPVHLNRSMTRANVETFALLLQYYGRRSMDEYATLVQRALELAEIPPNIYILNHLLYRDLRRGQHQAAWLRYADRSHVIVPDLETFECLWDCEKAHLDSLIVHKSDAFPGPRQIMREMISWYRAQSPSQRDAVCDDLSQDLYDLIMRCMSQSKDLAGALVALYALKQLFKSYPSETTSRTVILHVARMGVGEEVSKETKRSRHRKNPHRKTNLAVTDQIFKLITHQRAATLADYGMDDLEELNKDIQREEAVYILGAFLRKIMSRTMQQEQSVEDSIAQAALDMGVQGIGMEDPLPYKI